MAMLDPKTRQIGLLGPDACYSTDKFGRTARGARRQNNGFSKIPDQASPPIVGGPIARLLEAKPTKDLALQGS